MVDPGQGYPGPTVEAGPGSPPHTGDPPRKSSCPLVPYTFLDWLWLADVTFSGLGQSLWQEKWNSLIGYPLISDGDLKRGWGAERGWRGAAGGWRNRGEGVGKVGLGVEMRSHPLKKGEWLLSSKSQMSSTPIHILPSISTLTGDKALK